MRRTQRYSDDGPSTVTKLECNHEETPVTLKLREPTKQLACKLQVSVSKKKKKIQVRLRNFSRLKETKRHV